MRVPVGSFMLDTSCFWETLESLGNLNCFMGAFQVDIAHLFEHFLFSYFVFFSFIFILHEQGNFNYHNGTWGSRNSASLTPILPRCVFVKPWCLGRTPSKIIFINLAEATWVPLPSYHLPSQQLENAHGLARGSAVQCPYLLWPSGHSAVGQPGSVHLPDRLLDRGQNALQCTKGKRNPTACSKQYRGKFSELPLWAQETFGRKISKWSESAPPPLNLCICSYISKGLQVHQAINIPGRASA